MVYLGWRKETVTLLFSFQVLPERYLDAEPYRTGSISIIDRTRLVRVVRLRIQAKDQDTASRVAGEIKLAVELNRPPFGRCKRWPWFLDLLNDEQRNIDDEIWRYNKPGCWARIIVSMSSLPVSSSAFADASF